MRTLKPACTEPGQWDRAPDADASASEILAYLQHCGACAYHARLTQEEDRAFDPLLQAACRDLDVGDVVPARRSGSFLRMQRAQRQDTGALQDRARFERRLTQACIAAFSIVVLWISFATYRLDSNSAAEEGIVAADTLVRSPVPFSGGILAAMDKGRLYVSHIASEAPDEQAWPGTVSDTEKLTVAIPDYAFGSILRITNPLNGVSVVVKVVQRSYAEREITLSPNVATSLDLTGDAIVFVEVLSEPRPMNLAP